MKSDESDREKKSVIFSKERGIIWGWEVGKGRYEIVYRSVVRRDDEETMSKRHGGQENGKDMLEEGNDRGLAPKTQCMEGGELYKGIGGRDVKRYLLQYNPS